MIGKLDQRITFQRATASPDGIGGKTVAWANLPRNAAVWAAVTPRIGREGMVEGRMTAVNMTTFEVHNRADIAETDRIIWNGEAYNIRSVMRRGGRELFLQIDAERGVNP
jgi:SPP1 family predicted phage head-tail adaptor